MLGKSCYSRGTIEKVQHGIRNIDSHSENNYQNVVLSVRSCVVQNTNMVGFNFDKLIVHVRNEYRYAGNFKQANEAIYVRH